VAGPFLTHRLPAIAGGFVISGEQYYVQHKGGRPTCGQGGVGTRIACRPCSGPQRPVGSQLRCPTSSRAVHFLGFLNKTCQAGTKTTPYGPTCGPTLRGAADGQNWKKWTITVVGKAKDGNDLVTLENFYPGNKAL
jgi:hypothetical protein